ncbi:PKD domain-containing protein [Flavobacterium sp. CLA17]|uniref:PKD domain-containing protein n=1 Tax=Flavobacterium sp. CLA17 TaxID=2724135 RepID=UPI001492C5D2|nr:PKD domain-containing protein [Flavobacterium sp. CLA17]QSB27671.1 PKD domain-containing protein [Flavobacterium sp. CLA17]
MKLKYTLVFTIISFFIAIAGFAQQYSDKEIGFDVEKATISLKEHGIMDQHLSQEIIMMREVQLRQYLEMVKIKDDILKKTNAEQQILNKTNRSSLVTDIPQTEKDALQAFYNSTGGDNWTNKTGWDFSKPVTSWNGGTGWYGITVTNNHVSSIVISNNNLTGTIPAEIGLLNQLTVLYLVQNNLTGNIPGEIGQLTKIQNITLVQNKLTGNIPNTIGSLSQLTTLNLSNNNTLTGNIPTEIGQLNKLQSVDLSYNNLQGNIPAELFQLTNATNINLRINSLTGSIPNNIDQLTNVTNLDFSNNKLDGNIPAEIGQLKGKLAYLYLNQNKLEGNIPVVLYELTNLIWLNLSNNKLTGSISNKIGQLTKLSFLSVGYNTLEGNLPAEIGLLTNAAQITLHINKLSGPIPPQIGTLINLNYLTLQGNQFEGPVPSEIGQLTKLENLILADNLLTSIPAAINQLSKLRTLSLSRNKLTGELPDLTNLTLLKTFQYDNNNLRFKNFINQFQTYKTNVTTHTFSPQSKINKAEKIPKSAGQSVDLNMFATGDTEYLPSDTYKWFKNGVEIVGAVNSIYTISNLTTSNAGVYICRSYHTSSPDISPLVLEREPITLSIINCTPVIGTINPTTQNTFTNTDVNFSLTTTATGLTYEWTFQNVSNSTSFTSSSATYSYPTPGSYNVTLVVTDSNGCKTTFTKIMEVAAKPACVAIVGEIKTSSEKIIPNQNVTFSFETAATNFTYNWIFYNQAFVEIGRAATSTASRSYNVPGDYLVALEITDQNGCKTYKGLTVKVVADCPLIEGAIKMDTETPFLFTYTTFSFETTATDLTYTWNLKIPENSGYYNDPRGGNAYQVYLQYGEGDYTIMVDVKDSNDCVTHFEKIFRPTYDCKMNSVTGIIYNRTHSNYYSPQVLINKPNEFTFWPYSMWNLSDLTLNWELTKLDDTPITTFTGETFVFTPTTSDNLKLKLTIKDRNNCPHYFDRELLVTEACEFSGENLSGSIAFENEDNAEVSTIQINQTKELGFRPDYEITRSYTYKWEIYNVNDELVDSGNQEKHLLTLTTAGFYKVNVAIENEAGCILSFSKPVNCLIQNSCTNENPKSEIIKDIYLSVLKNLISRSLTKETDEHINASRATDEFTALKPYITNGTKDKIYNYTTVRNEQGRLISVRFSFSPERDYDVQILMKKGLWNYDSDYDGTFTQFSANIAAEIYMDLSQYSSSNEYLISCYVQNAQQSSVPDPENPPTLQKAQKTKKLSKISLNTNDCYKESEIRYIDFCPAEACRPTIGVIQSGFSLEYPSSQADKNSKKTGSKL